MGRRTERHMFSLKPYIFQMLIKQAEKENLSYSAYIEKLILQKNTEQEVIEELRKRNYKL